MTKDIRNNFIFSTIGILLLYFFYSVRNIMLPFVLGVIIAYFLGTPTAFLEKKIKSRKNASLLVVSLFSLIVLTFFVFVIPHLLSQLTDLVKDLAGYLNKNNNLIIEKITQLIQHIGIDDKLDYKKYLAQYTKDISSYFIGFVNNVLSTSIAFISVLSLLIITPITAYYFLSEWNNIINIIKSYIPEKKVEKAKNLFKEIDSVLSACIKGQLIVCIMLGLFYSLFLSIVGLQYGFLIGILTGLATFIPYFGMLAGSLIGIIVAIYQFGFDIAHLSVIIAIFTIGQTIEGTFITPRLVGSRINLHPLWIIFALFAGGTLCGFVGLLLALPVAGVIGVLVRFYIKEKKITKNGL